MGLISRIFSPYRALRKGVVRLHTNVVIGASGAVGSQTAQAKSGMVVTRSGAGVYVCTLDETYYGLAMANIIAKGTIAATDGYIGKVSAYDLSARTITFTLTQVSGAAADPPNPSELFIALDLITSNV